MDILKPNHIKINLTEDSSDFENSKYVEDLRNFSTISSFQCKAVDSVSTKVRVYATFSSREKAIATVDSLQKVEMSVPTHFLFSVKHIISVKYQLPSEILNFDRLKIRDHNAEYWDSGQLHYKIYNPANWVPKYTLMGLRIFDDTTEQVAKSKKFA